MTNYTAKTVVLTGVHRAPHQAFYTGVKFVVLAQHQWCYSNTFGCYFNTLWCYVDTLGCNINIWGCGPLVTPTGVKFNTAVFAVYEIIEFMAPVECLITNIVNRRNDTEIKQKTWVESVSYLIRRCRVLTLTEYNMLFFSLNKKEWICSLFKEWILEKSEIRVNLFGVNICVIHSVTTGITQGFRVIPEVTPKWVNNTNVHSKFTLISLFSKIHSLKSEHIHSLKSEHIHSFLFRE